MNSNAKYFDCHFHIIAKNFPVVSNQGFMPDAFTSEVYLDRLIPIAGDLVTQAVYMH
ncbi:MAG TPA: hypothetical protein VE616_13230 [Candidatus Udaeobacter sp.]|nr:hypothetical protein [Candidatus Udaeobacter sp.]